MWEENKEQASPKKSGSPLKQIAIGGGVVLVIIFALLAGYFFIQYQNAQKLLSNPAGITQQDAKKLADQVSALIDLPKDETPQVLNVSDKSKLITQPFFAKVEDGDKVLLYTKNRIAILYRPGANKIINYQSNITLSQGPTDNSGQVAGAETTPAQVSPTAGVSPTEVQKKAEPTSVPQPTSAQITPVQ